MGLARARTDVIVVGAGIVGAAVALRLAEDGRTVTVVAPSPGAAGDASSAAGAMLGTLGEVVATDDAERPAVDLELDLRLRSGQRWAPWLESIAERVDAPPLGRGTFVLGSASRPRDVAALDAMEAVAAKTGLPIQRVSQSDIPGLDPEAGRAEGRALFLADEGWVDAPAVLEATLAAAHTTGRVRRVRDRVTRVLHAHDRVRGVSTQESGELLGEVVVLCSGAQTSLVLQATPELATGVPWILPAKGVALEVAPPPRLLEPSPFQQPVRTPNREFACGLHLVPRGDGVYVGATNRVTRWHGITGGVTAGEVSGLLGAAARELFAPLQRWDIAKLSHGERPVAVDGIPVAGRVGALDGLLVASGTYRNGVLLAPLLADVIADELSGGEGLPAISPRDGRLARDLGPDEVLARGLAEYVELLGDAFFRPMQPGLDVLLPTLGRLVLGTSDEDEQIRAQLRATLEALPLVELVPEAIIEMCHPEFLLDDVARSQVTSPLGEI